MEEDWQSNLEHWLEPYLRDLGNKTRRRVCPAYIAGYGLSAPFRQALSTPGLCWAVGIPRHQKVYPADVQLTFPVAGRGQPRVRHVSDVKSRAAHAMLEEARWRQVSWRRATKGPPVSPLRRYARADRR